MSMNLLVSAAAGLAIFVIFYGLNVIWSGNSTGVASRLGNYAARQARNGPGEEGARKTKGTGLNRLLSATAGSQVATELARADLKITPGEYMALALLAGAVAFGLGFLLLHGNIVLAAIAGIAGFFVPRYYVKYLQGKRLRMFDSQLGDTIILLSNSLRSGYSLLQSMETASKELPSPISTEFARVTREIGLGLTIQEALANLLRRIPSPDLDLLITAINVQHEVGGNLAEILDTIAFTIRERVRIVGEIRSITAQQRISSYILTGLPVLLGIVLYILNPAYISKLWQNSCGWIMMGAGVSMIIIGFIVIQKIVTIEV